MRRMMRRMMRASRYAALAALSSSTVLLRALGVGAVGVGAISSAALGCGPSELQLNVKDVVDVQVRTPAIEQRDHRPRLRRSSFR